MKLTKLLILFLFLSLKGFSQTKSLITLSYNISEFCAGINGFLNPVITLDSKIINSEDLKVFRFKYNNLSGEGNLVINSNGVIDQSKTNPGSYTIYAYVNAIEISFNLKVNKCN
jgi:hypothetical protein